MKFENFHIPNNNTQYYYNNSLIYSRTTNYFYCYIISILILYEFWFSYGYIITRFLITATFCGVVLIRCRCLIWGGAYLRPALIRGKTVCDFDKLSLKKESKFWPQTPQVVRKLFTKSRARRNAFFFILEIRFVMRNEISQLMDVQGKSTTQIMYLVIIGLNLGVT